MGRGYSLAAGIVAFVVFMMVVGALVALTQRTNPIVIERRPAEVIIVERQPEREPVVVREQNASVPVIITTD
jgi:hypothetical protein